MTSIASWRRLGRVAACAALAASSLILVAAPASADDAVQSTATGAVSTPDVPSGVTLAAPTGSNAPRRALDASWSVVWHAVNEAVYDMEYKASDATGWTLCVSGDPAKTPLSAATTLAGGCQNFRVEHGVGDTGAVAVDMRDLDPHKNYIIRVRAKVYNFGNSNWFIYAVGKYPTPDVPDAPSAPTLSAAVRQMGISWSAPRSNGSDLTDYDVQYRACTATPKSCTSSPTWGSWTSHGHNDTTTSATLTGLVPGTAYQVQVRARNDVGGGAWSPSGQAAVLEGLAAPALSPGNQQIAVSWSAPTHGGSNVTGYNVQQRACTATKKDCSSSPSWGGWTAHAHTGTGTTATLSALTNGTAYQVRVQADYGGLVGDWSSASTAVVGRPVAPAAPSVSAVSDRRDALDVSWTAPSGNGSAVTGYGVQYRACTASPSTCASNPTWGAWSAYSHSGASTSAAISGLNRGTAYQVQVRAANAHGSGPWSPAGSAVTTATVQPSAPRNVALSKVAGSGAALGVSWSAPTDDGVDKDGTAITDYDVQYREYSYGSTWTSVTHDGTATTASITGLSPGTTYQVQVRAANGTGQGRLDGPWSASASAATHPGPAAPSVNAWGGVTDGCGGDYCAHMDVSWSAPTQCRSGITPCDLTVVDYDVEYKYIWSSKWTDVALSSDTATSARIGSLGHSTSYYVRVRAANAIGEGEWSDDVNVYTPDKPRPKPPPDDNDGNDSDDSNSGNDGSDNSNSPTSSPLTSSPGASASSGGAVPTSAELGDPERYWGADRYATAADAAEAYVLSYASASAGRQVSTVIVASGVNYPDALAAAPLSAVLAAPVLLTTPDTLHDAVTQFLAAHPNISTAHLLGGTAAVSETVENELRALVPNGRRLWGPSRYETAVEIAELVGQPGPWCHSNERTVILVSGSSWADAVIAGPVAYRGRHPVVLTESDALSESTEQYLESASPDQVVIVGGASEVNDSVRAAVEALGITVTRISGDSPADRAAAMARAVQVPATVALSTAGCVGATTIGLVTSVMYPDALTAGPLLGLRRAPLLFTHSTDGLPLATQRYVASDAYKPTSAAAPVIVIGGPAAVSDYDVQRIINIAS